MRVKVVSKNVGVGENCAKEGIAQEYSSASPRAKLWNMYLWVQISCWGKRIEFELVHKIWARKKTPAASFLKCLLENTWIKSAFPYALPPCHERAKWNTVKVVGGANAKLPHCTPNSHQRFRGWQGESVVGVWFVRIRRVTNGSFVICMRNEVEDRSVVVHDEANGQWELWGSMKRDQLKDMERLVPIK